MTQLLDLDLDGPVVVKMTRFHDFRGWFSELFNARRLEALGIPSRFVQDNMSFSAEVGTLRGLHAQRAPMTQAKLITAVQGALFDVVVDCRKGSPTFGQHRAVVIDAEEPSALYVPGGFCHGFLTLKPATTVFYKVDNYFSPEHETGLRWDDPALGIAWPLQGRTPIMTERDRKLPTLAGLDPL